jgi:hypothetical protein
VSLFKGPEAHAANPPDTWKVVKRNARSWAVLTKDDTILEYHERKRDAVAALVDEQSFLRTLYRREAEWYAGNTPTGWVDYDPAKHSPKGA